MSTAQFLYKKVNLNIIYTFLEGFRNKKNNIKIFIIPKK